MPKEFGQPKPSEHAVSTPADGTWDWDKARGSLADELGGLNAAFVVQALSRLLLPQFCFNRLRTALWRVSKYRIGDGSLIMGDIHLSGSGDWTSLFSVGKETYISGPLRINLGGAVRIGDRVNFGHDCLLLTVDHSMGGPERRAGLSENKSIVIGDGAWIASRVVILPGVEIGKGAVVAAGAVVTKDVPPHTLVGGIPAKVLRQLSVP